MRLLVRSLGPVPEELNADGDSSVAELQALIKGSSALAETSASHSFRLVHRGRVLRDGTARLRDVLSEGDVVVALPAREVAPRRAARPPSRGPTLAQINAAIRPDLPAQGPETAWELAARQQQRGGDDAAGGGDAAGPAQQLLEQALLSGDMAALRVYLEQLQEALRGPDGQQIAQMAGAAGGGAGVAGGAAELPLAAALDAFFGLAGDGGGVAAAQHEHDEEEGEGVDFGTEEDEDEEHSEYDEDEEGHSEEGEEGGEGYTDDEGLTDDSEEEHAGAAPLAPPRVPELDSRALAELMDMGFPEALCRNALLWGRNAFQPALEWLLAHAEDPGAAEPLSDAQLASLYGRGPRGAGPQVDQGHLAHLIDMGFERSQAEQALRAFHNSLPAAASWLVSLGAFAAALPGGGGGGAGPSGQQQQQQQQQQVGAPEEHSEDDWATDSSPRSAHSHSSSEAGGSASGDGEGAGDMPGLASTGGSSEEEEEQAPPLRQQQQQQGGDDLPGLMDVAGSSSDDEGGPPQVQAASSDDAA